IASPLPHPLPLHAALPIFFLSLGDRPYKGLDAPSIWADAMAAEPGPQPEITETRLDACLSAIADFADLKSMWTAGHSRGVADLRSEEHTSELQSPYDLVCR